MGFPKRTTKKGKQKTVTGRKTLVIVPAYRIKAKRVKGGGGSTKGGASHRLGGKLRG
ncbi:MAG: hypothetical protein F6J98_01735 [Moorea sp. SIO4G2]|nr:hypothetical protein [Moorena sp. SIO4G2]